MELTGPTDEQYQEKAAEMFAEARYAVDDLIIGAMDEAPGVDRVGGGAVASGAWVQAWLFVGDEEFDALAEIPR